MTNGETTRRHSEALRLFEAGLKAFYEATGASAAPTWASGPKDGQPDRLFDPRPPVAPDLGQPRDLADAT
jgi:hypothetical protein